MIDEHNRLGATIDGIGESIQLSSLWKTVGLGLGLFVWLGYGVVPVGFFCHYKVADTGRITEAGFCTRRGVMGAFQGSS